MDSRASAETKEAVWIWRIVMTTKKIATPSSQICGKCSGNKKVLPSGYWKCYRCEKIYTRKSEQKLKKMIFSWYGSVCRCCGEGNLCFLTIDHVHDDGVRECYGKTHVQRQLNPKGTGVHFYRKIKQIGFENRPLDLQILCWNCQWGKRLGNGFCPHHPEVNLKEERP